MREIKVHNVTIYHGQKAGVPILKALHGATESIKIISPFLSPDFASLLTKKAADGVKVHLLSSSDLKASRDGKKSLKRLFHFKENIRFSLGVYFFKLLLFTALLGIVLLFFHGINQALYSSGSVLFLGLVIYKILNKKTRKAIPLIHLGLVLSPYSAPLSSGNKKLFSLHSKLYIIDDKIAYSGSLNFTKAGFFNNFESRIKIVDPAAVDFLSSQFQQLFDTSKFSITSF